MDLNYQKVLFLTALVHSSHFIMFSGNFLCFTSVSEESTPVENSSQQSSHDAPEIAIGIILASIKFHKAADTNRIVQGLR